MRTLIFAFLLLAGSARAQTEELEFSLGPAIGLKGQTIHYADGLAAKSTSLNLGAGLHGSAAFLIPISLRISLVGAFQFFTMERVIRQSFFNLNGQSRAVFSSSRIKNKIKNSGYFVFTGFRYYPLKKDNKLYPWLQVGAGAGVHDLKRHFRLSNNQGTTFYKYQTPSLLAYTAQVSLGGQYEVDYNVSFSLELRYRYSKVLLSNTSETIIHNQIEPGFNVSGSSGGTNELFPASSIAIMGGMAIKLPLL